MQYGEGDGWWTALEEGAGDGVVSRPGCSQMRTWRGSKRLAFSRCEVVSVPPRPSRRGTEWAPRPGLCPVPVATVRRCGADRVLLFIGDWLRRCRLELGMYYVVT